MTNGVKITKVSVETVDENDKIDITHLHENNIKSIHWKKLGKTVGEVISCMPPVVP